MPRFPIARRTAVATGLLALILASAAGAEPIALDWSPWQAVGADPPKTVIQKRSRTVDGSTQMQFRNTGGSPIYIEVQVFSAGSQYFVGFFLKPGAVDELQDPYDNAFTNVYRAEYRDRPPDVVLSPPAPEDQEKSIRPTRDELVRRLGRDYRVSNLDGNSLQRYEFTADGFIVGIGRFSTRVAVRDIDIAGMRSAEAQNSDGVVTYPFIEFIARGRSSEIVLPLGTSTIETTRVALLLKRYVTLLQHPATTRPSK